MSKQTYDITPVMCDIFDKMVDEFVNARDDKGELLNDPEQLLWESKVFLKHSIEKNVSGYVRTSPVRRQLKNRTLYGRF